VKNAFQHFPGVPAGLQERSRGSAERSPRVMFVLPRSALEGRQKGQVGSTRWVASDFWRPFRTRTLLRAWVRGLRSADPRLRSDGPCRGVFWSESATTFHKKLRPSATRARPGWPVRRVLAVVDPPVPTLRRHGLESSPPQHVPLPSPPPPLAFGGGWGRGTQAGRMCYDGTSVPLVCGRPVIPGAEVGGGKHKRDACATVEQASRLFADDR